MSKKFTQLPSSLMALMDEPRGACETNTSPNMDALRQIWKLRWDCVYVLHLRTFIPLLSIIWVVAPTRLQEPFYSTISPTRK